MSPRIAETPDGRRLEVRREIGGRSGAWDLLVPPARWPDWGPSARAVDCPADRITAGTTGRIRVPGAVWIPFEFTGCRNLD